MNVQALVLAAGKGVRMKSQLPKVLHPILGKPIILYALDNLKRAGFVKPIIVVGSGANLVRKAVGKNFQYVIQKRQLGSGHAVLCARSLFLNSNSLLVVCGDMPLFSPESFLGIVKKHEKEKAIMTITSVTFSNPSFYKYGRILRDQEGNPKKIIEEKVATEEEKKIKESNAGLYCFNSKWLYQNLPKLKKSQIGEYYLTDLFGLAVRQNKKIAIFKIKDPEEAEGINTKEQFERVEQIMKRGIIKRRSIK